MENNRIVEFKEVSSDWLEEKSNYVKKGTCSAYALSLTKHILPYFGKSVNITEGQCQDFIIKKLDEGMSIKTVKDMMIVVKMIHRFGCKRFGWEPVALELKYPSTHRAPSVEVLSIQAQRTLMKYVRENLTFRNLGILLCISTGMRIGEICALKWGDIDMNEGVVRINRTIQRVYFVDMNGLRGKTQVVESSPKTKNSIREIPLLKEVRNLIKPLIKVMNRDHYVLSNDSKAIEPRTYRVYYRSLLEKLGMPHLKFHGLRHSFATRCIESGCDYKTVSTLLGHADINTTLNLYVHPNMEQKRRVIEKMGKCL